MWMVIPCTLVPYITISVAVTEGQTVFGVYVDGHTTCTPLATHPKLTACKTSGNCYTCVMITVQLHRIKKGHLFYKNSCLYNGIDIFIKQIKDAH